MNREKGVSSLALVLMLLVLGSLLLQGMSQQDRSFASRVSIESQSLRRQAIVQSALAWGKMHSWQTQPAVQCSQYAGTDARVCLRLLADNEAGNDSNLLIVFYVQIMPDDFVMQLHRF
ncbi:putative alpha-mannosidase [Shigella sonnei]|nr:putative alpha-mannosidase [Shigella sonnei]